MSGLRPETANGGPREEVEVVYALPDRQRVIRLALPETGLTARQAVEQSGLPHEFPDIGRRPLVLGIFGAVCDADRPLREGDRVEIYRPLAHDPRAIRRDRAAATARRRR